MRMKTALTLDVICWVGATIALWFFQFPLIAALVGATGGVYLVNAFRQYFKVLYAERIMVEAMAAVERGEAHFIEVEGRSELEKLLNRIEKDPDAFFRELEEEAKALQALEHDDEFVSRTPEDDKEDK